MKTYALKKDKQQTLIQSPTIQPKAEKQQFMLNDNRPETVMQQRLVDTVNNSDRVTQLQQYQDMADKSQTAKANQTGLPHQLKSGIENLSGYAMDDVKVHYNSDKPAQLKAHAYAQGTDIHLASGQEKHLPHEAWHVVQQKQGRVKPTLQMKGKVKVNDDKGLEREADVMGAKAQTISSHASKLKTLQQAAHNYTPKTNTPTQLKNDTAKWVKTSGDVIQRYTGTSSGYSASSYASSASSYGYSAKSSSASSYGGYSAKSASASLSAANVIATPAPKLRGQEGIVDNVKKNKNKADDIIAVPLTAHKGKEAYDASPKEVKIVKSIYAKLKEAIRIGSEGGSELDTIKASAKDALRSIMDSLQEQINKIPKILGPIISIAQGVFKIVKGIYTIVKKALGMRKSTSIINEVNQSTATDNIKEERTGAMTYLWERFTKIIRDEVRSVAAGISKITSAIAVITVVGGVLAPFTTLIDALISNIPGWWNIIKQKGRDKGWPFFNSDKTTDKKRDQVNYHASIIYAMLTEKGTGRDDLNEDLLSALTMGKDDFSKISEADGLKAKAKSCAKKMQRKVPLESLKMGLNAEEKKAISDQEAINNIIKTLTSGSRTEFLEKKKKS
jgi:hypothetical protein